jgi:thioredoxin-like negative regulator of GroEL
MSIPHLLFFTTTHSGPGRRMESLLAKLSRKERGRLRVTRVDSERMGKVAERLGVTVIPTLLLVMDGVPIARLEGRSSEPQIERMLAEHLAEGNPDPDRSLAA